MAKNSIDIQASPVRVFEYVADLRRHGEWAGHELHIEPVTDGGTEVGSRFVSTGKQLGTLLKDSLLVTEYEPARRLSFESTGRGGTWRHTFEVKPTPEGSTLTRTMEPAKPSFFLKLFRPLVDIALRRRHQPDLQRLKARLEAKETP